jgi:hypothetical protein
MDDLHLKSRLDDALDRQLEPIRPEVAEILEISQRARRRRTVIRSVPAAALVAVVLFGTAWLATSDFTDRLNGNSVEMATGQDTAQADSPATASDERTAVEAVEWRVPRTDSELTTACRNARVASRWTVEDLFDSAQARLVAQAKSPLRVWALFSSQDGESWGRCELRAHHSELVVFEAATTWVAADDHFSTDVVCDAARCRTEARLVTQLSEVVDQVQIRFVDGSRQVQNTNKGWVAMTHLLDVDPGQPVVKTVTYLDASGTVLAEYADTTIAGVESRDVPSLADYSVLNEAGRLRQ